MAHLFGQLKKQLIAIICNRRRHEARCYLLSTELDTGLFYAAMKALVPSWDKYCNIISDYYGVWRAPSAAEVQCVYRSRNKVMYISVFVT